LWPGTAYLACIQILAQVRFIYQVAFPGRPEWQAEAYEATNYGVRHALIALCLRFAGDLFPLAFSLKWLQQVEIPRTFDAGQLAAIPIAPMGVDVLGDPYYYGPDAFDPPYDFFAWGFIQELYRPEVEDESLLPEYPLPFPLPRDWSLARTANLIRQAALPEPLCHLAVVADFIANNTGNPWLDYEIDNYYEYIYDESPLEWTPENVRRLKQQYQEALELEGRMSALESWVAEDSPNRMRAILALIQILYANDHFNHFPQTPRPSFGLAQDKPATGQPFRYLPRLPAGRPGANSADAGEYPGVAGII
jgi:hypothetical protein